MKKILAIVLAALMLVACFAGCGAEKEDTTPATNDASPSDAPETKEVVNLTLTGSELDAPQAALTKLAKEFEELHADEAEIHVTVGALSEASAKDQVIVDLEAAPDVFYFADDQTAALVNAGALMEVIDYEEVIAANGGAEALSIKASTIDGTLYAYPATADNGYFVWYNTNYLTKEDCATLDGMIAKAEELGKFVTMEMTGEWYSYSFFKGAGYNMSLDSATGKNVCDWNTEGGTDVLQAMLDIVAKPGFKSMGNGEVAAYLADDTCIAFIGGAWNISVVQENWGEDFDCCKLPTYTLNGEQVQMGSFAGYKLVGVNAYSENVYWAMELAKYITSEQGQITMFEEASFGPSNVNAAASDAVSANPAFKALAEQSEFAVIQSVGGNYWESAKAMFGIIAGGNVDGNDLQQLLDDAVAGITA